MQVHLVRFATEKGRKKRSRRQLRHKKTPFFPLKKKGKS